jgi:hypothetical protein
VESVRRGDCRLGRVGEGIPQRAPVCGLARTHAATVLLRRLGGISKRGDAYLRMVLVLGARSVLQNAGRYTDRLSRWATGHESQIPHFKAFFVADESGPKRLRGRDATVVRRCTRAGATAVYAQQNRRLPRVVMLRCTIMVWPRATDVNPRHNLLVARTAARRHARTQP